MGWSVNGPALRVNAGHGLCMGWAEHGQGWPCAGQLMGWTRQGICMVWVWARHGMGWVWVGLFICGDGQMTGWAYFRPGMGLAELWP
jgi:hypothetical protein